MHDPYAYHSEADAICCAHIALLLENYVLANIPDSELRPEWV